MKFDAAEAALEGLRLTRREPLAVGIWALLMLAFSILTTVLMLGMFPGLLERMDSAEAAGDPAAMFAVMGQMGQMYLVLIPICLVFYAVFYCAVYRAVLRPEERKLGYLRLGGDELRMIGLMFYQLVVWIGFFIVASIILTILAVVGALIFGGSLMAGAQLDASSSIAIILGVALMYLLMLVASIYLAVKLSLAAPMTFDRKAIRLFSAWPLTKGHFWPLFGCYLLAAVVGIVVSLLGGAISMVGLVVFGEFHSMSQMFEPDMSSLQAYLTPGRLLSVVISSVISTLAYAIFIAPAAVAYRDITRTSAD